MSGICGMIRFDRGAADVAAVARLLERRGPDGTHLWQNGPAALGHTLLATTPEALVEVLPLTDRETGCTITADIRLDNREQLIPVLGLADEARIVGDGELALRAYLRWGEDCLDHLLGDFAFAIHDPRANRLFSARDQMGLRQLIYHHQPGRLFAFATEPDALVAHPDVPRRLNETRVADFLENGEANDATITFYEEVLRLPAAHCLRVDASGVTLRRYWKPVPGPELHLPSDEAYAQAFLEVFTEAVRCRLRSAGPVGSMLSGGMDSGSVVAVASRLLAAEGRGPLPTFSAVGPDPDACIETRTIHAALTLPNLDPYLVSHADLAPIAPDLIRLVAENEPFDGHMTLVRAVYLLAHRAGVKVILDGVAGDVVLGSGTMMSRMLRRGELCEAWREAKGEARFWGAHYPTWKSMGAGLRHALIPDWLRYLRRTFRTSRLSRPRLNVVAPAFARRIGYLDRLRQERAQHPLGRLPNAEERAQAVIATHLTAGRERYDRTASVLAIEPRDPFTDLRVIAFVLRLPDGQFQRDGWPKLILRHAMADLLPDAVRWRRGKEHLGWTFTRNLWSSQGNFSTDIRNVRQMLLGWLRPRVTDATGQGAVDAVELEFDTELFFLSAWQRQRKLRGSE